jgi:hypothetical protein
VVSATVYGKQSFEVDENAHGKVQQVFEKVLEWTLPERYEKGKASEYLSSMINQNTRLISVTHFASCVNQFSMLVLHALLLV